MRLWSLLSCVVGAAVLGAVQVLLIGPAAIRSADDRSSAIRSANARSHAHESPPPAPGALTKLPLPVLVVNEQRPHSSDGHATATRSADARSRAPRSLPPATDALVAEVPIQVPLVTAEQSNLGMDLDARYPVEHAFWSHVHTMTAAQQAWAPLGRTLEHDAPWLAELRRQAPQSAFTIPEEIHQTWKDAHPPRKLFSPRWARSLRDLNPGWQYRLWTDAENRALIATRYPSLLAMYDGYASAIQRADFARYAIVHSHGGVYADLDTECFQPFAPLLEGAALVLSYKSGANFSRGACNSIFASAAAHPFWPVVFDVLRNRSQTSLETGHTAVLYSTGPSVLREALRRLLRLPDGHPITPAALDLLRKHLGIVVLDAARLHPVTADRRTEDSAATRPPDAVCTHHFVSSWVAHDKTRHENTERRRREGDATAAMHGLAQPVLRENTWAEDTNQESDRGGRGEAATTPARSHRKVRRAMAHRSTSKGK